MSEIFIQKNEPAIWEGIPTQNRQPQGVYGKPTVFLNVNNDMWQEIVEWKVFKFKVVYKQLNYEPQTLELLDNSSGRGDVQVKLTGSLNLQRSQSCEVKARFTKDKSQEKQYNGNFRFCDCNLTKTQWNALQHSEINNADNSYKTRMNFVRKLNMIGLKDKFFWIEDFVLNKAPLIIHIDFEKLKNQGVLDSFLNDTNQRNQFETKISGGCTDLTARTKWETTLFGDAQNGQDLHRPKQGAMNITQDYQGVTSAWQYGTSYLVLNNNLRWRCTFTATDSSYVKDPKIGFGTLRRPTAVLDVLEEKEIKTIFKNQQRAANSQGFAQQEIQIHGPVRFKEDIVSVVIDPFLRQEIKNKIEKWALQNSINQSYMDICTEDYVRLLKNFKDVDLNSLLQSK